ncbi:SigB/SigF/SigG family RNA polymerase sigma factor [Streptomyces formicae]|uniref:SigB/SigF/SigG family RNA polymerase sigma factor n=1 Tax=Streptomyces formicae TaxID=1616117 RepID=A0ABY3WMY0_9ACTN|nr:SigB/SigF/SigG family RNA polymerase sigma factor [Streptomyces formicae]UNM12667.1 SigB/SigF/SigG family RNA polymerase sigma factor [Streptomyces formicae]
MSSLPLAREPTVGAAPQERSAAPDGLPEIPDPRTISTMDARSLSVALFRRLHTLEEGTPEYSYVRNTLVELNMSLVRFAAGRFRGRSEPMEDILQVGTVGLIKAINRFDVEREVEFTSFALPTVVGEIKRFFRDTSWAVRVPRRLQELRLDLAKAFDTLEQDLGRAPTTAELADRLDVTEPEVLEGQRAANGYVARSIEPLEDDEPPGQLARRLGAEDPALDVVECLQCLKPVIAALPERERTILSLRFGDELTQSEIGERLGISQMHVSRLLARILEQLRDALLTDEADEAVPGAE